MVAKVVIESDNLHYTEEHITADYSYHTVKSVLHEDTVTLRPLTVQCSIRTERRVPKLGVMLVGWGGNNGSTVTAAVYANLHKLKWETKSGVQHANYYGSLTQAATMEVAPNVHVPFSSVLPMVNPNDIVFDGWDISALNISDALRRAQTLDVSLQKQLEKYLTPLKPRAAIFDPEFVANNQVDRADNVIRGSKYQQVEQIRSDIREFKQSSGVDKVIVLWTANTERFCAVRDGLNVTAAQLLFSVKNDESEISPSTLYGLASVLEDCAYINGSPQNSLVPGLVQLAEQRSVFVGGDDFKSGQTKIKSVLVDFLVSSGIKPVSIVSYNHLGNNDGKNLSEPLQFRSKEVSKSNVVDDMVSSNSILYEPGERPDHCVVIKYVPYVGDSKRAMDEYTSEIMCGGHNTIVIHNTCEDSLLASPLIIDLVVLTELFQRVQLCPDPQSGCYHSFSAVLSLLGFLCKAPLVPEGMPVVNALQRQRACIENTLRACVALPPVNNMTLEHRVPRDKRHLWAQLADQCDGLKEDVVGAKHGDCAMGNGFTNGYH